MINKSKISISLDKIREGLKLIIYEEHQNTLFEISDSEIEEYGESRFQLLEGRSYNYYFNSLKYQLRETSGLVFNSIRIDVSEGRITPNIFVGSLTLYLIDREDPTFEDYINVEVLATKMNNEIDKSYRENYRFMLESITEKCTELLMQINSPINQDYEIDFDSDYKTIYQRFSFVKSLINSNNFYESIQRVIASPTTFWKKDDDLKDIRSIRRFNNHTIRQLVTTNNRFDIDKNNYLAKTYGLNDLPRKIISSRKIETVNTPENRFIKYSLETYLKFLVDCSIIFAKNNYSREKKEANNLITELENLLNHPFFNDISRPNTLRLNSPVLQRKSGYRELLNSWLKFSLAAKLIWNGSNDVFDAGKRDIAVLYEYWLFFVLYELFRNKFNLHKHSFAENPYEHLIVPTNDGLNVMLKSGKHTALEGIFNSRSRNLCIKFSYNRTFSGGVEYTKKQAGSWTKTLRPDYTLSIWPSDYLEIEAEELEVIVHIHFDSKYKVDQYIVKQEFKVLSIDTNGKDLLEQEKEDEKRGIYKNADLLKMHAYKDAIRRTGGAYILYPGTESLPPLKGFHEIIPGLGAFAIRPSLQNNGITELSNFIDSVINHLFDRASQREYAAAKTYQIFKTKKSAFKEDNITPNILNEAMPEYFHQSKHEKIIPEETFVLIGFCNRIENYDWYKKTGIYNFRIDDDNGSLVLENKVVNAKYLLIREPGKSNVNKLFRIKSKGPRVLKGLTLKQKGYISDNLKDYYLTIEIENQECSDFDDSGFNFKELDDYKQIEAKIYPKSAEGIPFAVSIYELMGVIVK